MSYDLRVFGAEALGTDRIASLLAEAGNSIAHASHDHLVLSRGVRNQTQPVLSIDGPVQVERTDLPAAVAQTAVGVSTLYEISVQDTSRAGTTLAQKTSRVIAAAAQGVVYDPQGNSVTWPRTGTRRVYLPSTPEATELSFRWFIRREDMPPDLPGVLLDTLTTWMPEALPRRYGPTEPFQHKFDEEGADGFRRAWHAEQIMLFWRASKPWTSGHAADLGVNATNKVNAVEHPVGTIGLDIDLRALDDPRWRADVTALFGQLSARTSAFYAHAYLDRGSLIPEDSSWADGLSMQNKLSLALSGRWHGIPPYPLWLAWFGDLYRPLLEQQRSLRVDEFHGGLFWRSQDVPRDLKAHTWPTEWTMRVVQPDPQSSTQGVPAQTMPAGL